MKKYFFPVTFAARLTFSTISLCSLVVSSALKALELVRMKNSLSSLKALIRVSVFQSV